jgi:ABC-type proline/glycine betaine transport system substrate-binding protein
MKRLLIAASVAVLVGAASGALAGEVKGPPGTINNTNVTAAPANANSNCAYSGLNDFDLSDPVGQLDSFVQTAADAWKYYGLPHGFPGTSGACHGGTNEDRQK